MKSKLMKYQIKPEFVGKVKLEHSTGSTLLDESTPQETLANLFDTVLGKHFIEPALAPVVADVKTK